jgi:hypothetical protein
MAFGSLIVLESFGADRKLVGLSAKLKIKDYHPEAGDWHWFHYDARGNVLSCGRTPVCIGCHEGRREDDFLLTRMVK